MKKCPKCHGVGNIKNYYKIDGGMCYECNGKGYVSDNHKMHQKPKPFATTEAQKKQWEVKHSQAINEQNAVIEKIRSIMPDKSKCYTRELFESMTSSEQNEIKARLNSEEEFHTYLIQMNEEYAEYLEQ